MPSNRKIYNQEAVFVSSNVSSGLNFMTLDSSLTNSDSLSAFNLTFPLNRIQSASYGFSEIRTDLKSLGTYGNLSRPILQPLDINLSINFLQMGIINEKRLGFSVNYPKSGVITNPALFNSFVCPISGFLDRRYERSNEIASLNWPLSTTEPKNIYIATRRDNLDLNDTGNITYQDKNIDNFAFGDCYINSYKTSAAVGGIPSASVDFICNNVLFYSGGSGLNTPSLNPKDMTPRSGILFNLPSTYQGANQATVLLPKDITLNISLSDSSTQYNLPVDMSDIKIQGYNIDLQLNREPLNNIGYKLPMDRRIVPPTFANLEINTIVGDNATGSSLNNMIRDKEYDITIRLKYQPKQLGGIIGIQYDFLKAKFNSINLSDAIGQNRTANLSFTSELYPNDLTRGFFMSGQLGIPTGAVGGNTEYLLLEDGTALLYEDGTKVIIGDVTGQLKLLF